MNNRIKLSADYFHIVNDNLLLTRNLAETTGFSTSIENIGEIKNQGVEFTVDVNALRTKDWEWNISANFSRDRNEVTKLYGDGVQFIKKYDGDHNLQKKVTFSWVNRVILFIYGAQVASLRLLTWIV